MERRLDTEVEKDTSVSDDIATAPASASAIERLYGSVPVSHSLVVKIRIAGHAAATHPEKATEV